MESKLNSSDFIFKNEKMLDGPAIYKFSREVADNPKIKRVVVDHIFEHNNNAMQAAWMLRAVAHILMYRQDEPLTIHFKSLPSNQNLAAFIKLCRVIAATTKLQSLVIEGIIDSGCSSHLVEALSNNRSIENLVVSCYPQEVASLATKEKIEVKHGSSLLDSNAQITIKNLCQAIVNNKTMQSFHLIKLFDFTVKPEFSNLWCNDQQKEKEFLSKQLGAVIKNSDTIRSVNLACLELTDKNFGDFCKDFLFSRKNIDEIAMSYDVLPKKLLGIEEILASSQNSLTMESQGFIYPLFQFCQNLEIRGITNNVLRKYCLDQNLKQYKQTNNTISQIKSDEFFKSEDERVYRLVRDPRPDLQKNEVSFKSGDWYEGKEEAAQQPHNTKNRKMVVLEELFCQASLITLNKGMMSLASIESLRSFMSLNYEYMASLADLSFAKEFAYILMADERSARLIAGENIVEQPEITKVMPKIDFAIVPK